MKHERWGGAHLACWLPVNPGTRPHILLHSLVSLPSRGETGSSGKTEWLCRIVRKSEPVPASLVFAERSPTHELTRVYFRRG